MALVEPNVMLNSIMGKLYDVLTNGDDTVAKSEDNFLSWAPPGIVIDPRDFAFLTQGLTGIVKKPRLEETGALAAAPPAPAGPAPAEGAPAEPPRPAITPELLEKLRAEDTAGLYSQAEGFARLVDFVPDVAANTNDAYNRLSVMNNEGSLSERYEYILRMSQVMETVLPDDVKKKIEKFRGLLSVTKTRKNIVTDEEEQVVEPSPMVVAYNDKMAAYENKALEYNSRRIDALSADNARAVHYWTMNANILRNQVRAAMNDWVANGFKNENEQIAAFIDQVIMGVTMDAAVQLALMAKAKKVFGTEGSFLSFPVAPLPYTRPQLEFFDDKDADAARASDQNLAQFSALVNLIPPDEAWLPTETVFLWQVYEEVLKGVYASANRTDEEEAAYQAAGAFLGSVPPGGGWEDSPAVKAYKTFEDAVRVAQEQYLAAKSTAESASDPEQQKRWREVDEPAARASLDA